MSVIQNDLDPDVQIGLQLPLGVHQDGVFKQTQTLLEQTKSNIRNLLLTRRGERLGNPTFGSELLSVVFEPINDDTQNQIEEKIRASIAEFLPHVSIRSISFSDDANTLSPRIIFSVNTDTTTLEDITLDLPSLEDAEGNVGDTFSRQLGG
jgi:phage baseplate assembly protein W